jgi:acyl-homoserine-lactone acylase
MLPAMSFRRVFGQPTGRQPILLASLLAMVLGTGACASAPPAATPTTATVAPVPELPAAARQVEIRRNEYGVPHIRAENLRAAYFALAWVQLEDHGPRIIEGMNSARGRRALVHGEAAIDADARARLRHADAVSAWPLLDNDTQDAYAGFADGMNHFIRVHADSLPYWMRPDFTPQDVLAQDLHAPPEAALNRFREQVIAAAPSALSSADTLEPYDANRAPGAEVTVAGWQEAENVGSNAWALAPERTTSGHAILLRNPHLAWSAGYYEAHVRVPGKLDFYGDFRIGGPFTVIGGFNRDLGFATTNNATRSHEFYALRLDPARPDHVLLDGASRPLERKTATVEYLRDDGGRATATRQFRFLDGHPVFHQSDSLAYVYRHGAKGEYRAGQQWLRMMQARSLEEWKDAMRIGARVTSNLTYADRSGNIFYVWVATAPILPHDPGGDSVAVRVSRSDEMWSRVVHFDSLPQLHNPPGGYVRNENDSPHYTNLNVVMPHAFNFEVQPPRFGLRSQHGHMLLHNDRVFSLEDVVVAKHSMRMLLADRVKGDLLAAVIATVPDDETMAALRLLEAWDNTVAADSRGAVLFETWWNQYRTLLRGRDLHAVQWTPDRPTDTPHGLADPARAAEAFTWALAQVARLFGSWDVSWGEVHRVRRGAVDVPVGGCGGALGCFRVLNFEAHADGRRAVNGGDGWVIAVEFGAEPRAYSVLAYGQSPDPRSPHHADQAALFAANRMKPVRWSEAEIEAATVRRYRPGEARHMIARPNYEAPDNP